MGNYVPSSPSETKEMLDFLGLPSLDALYRQVPKEVYGKGIDIPEGKSEMEVLLDIEHTGAKNRRFTSIFRGAGAYCHYIPAIVKQVINKEAFRTTYTPYQAEISQGILQSIFEYQTMISELTGMDVSNASVYDGATAAAEAVFMCLERKRNEILASAAMHPQVLEVMKTYCESRHVKLTLIPAKEGKTDGEALSSLLNESTAAVFFQNPNFFGLIEDGDRLVTLAHEAGARAVMSVSPMSLGLLKTPGEYGADIAVGDGQELGLPLSFGGPYMGFMTCREKLMRKLPGRIVGETTDSRGNRCYVLTLQAREQHIRREKASSNICSNEALCTMASGAYMAALGPEGMKEAASQCAAKAHYLADKLSEIGFPLKYKGPFFDEFVTDSPIPPKDVEKLLEKENILGGLPLKEGILWCATEMNSREDMDRLVSILKGGMAHGAHI
ncbi:aminomethyl-transferring glycine dehydrogenase subunit GcvPA [uncultured Dialister sp.]|uniref:aminomethyl-transferring glycine dehydrogenase subunit GcvPA n=1 Tax=uncultured Dialister sp. TaxID=278064 RepID=UPI00262B9314|nr:aminomethyl-transferring glycine dehydrogenase subunit GcvPA [uncultured Dialister sp.]